MPGKKTLKITHVIFDLDGLLIDTEPSYTETHTFAMEQYGKKFTLGLKSFTMGMKHDVAIKILLDKKLQFSKPDWLGRVVEFLIANKVSVKEYNKLCRPVLFEKLPHYPKMPGISNQLLHIVVYYSIGLADKVSVKEYDKLYRPVLFEKLPHCPKMPGALRLVQHFHDHNIPMAICSGSSNHSFKFKTMNHKDLTDLIPVQVKCGSDPEIEEGKPSAEAYLVTMQRFRNPPVSPSNVLVFEDARMVFWPLFVLA
ncbi:hypothetical protein DINM_002615 [Dirofilaria immitis]|nr:hypothetical protein [Dirofilaria immitis]